MTLEELDAQLERIDEAANEINCLAIEHCVGASDEFHEQVLRIARARGAIRGAFRRMLDEAPDDDYAREPRLTRHPSQCGCCGKLIGRTMERELTYCPDQAPAPVEG